MTIHLIERAKKFQERTAILTPKGSFSYSDLFQQSEQVAKNLLHSSSDLKEKRVAFLLPSDFSYVKVQWGIWRAGGIAVPLCTSHPAPELEYIVQNSGASAIVTNNDFIDIIKPIAKRTRTQIILESAFCTQIDSPELPLLSSKRRAMILYTSGTTGRPKGVISTHKNIQSQIETLVKAWKWNQDDHILQILPLHHVHGIINILNCALWSGATCEMLLNFNSKVVWQHFVKSNLTLFMAVPTIYSKLISTWEESPPEQQQFWSKACSKIRLMVSGSAALPIQTLKKWKRISGHFLLERYGMTEIGMALSNPLDGNRVPGYLGLPLPGVKVRLVNENGHVVEPGIPGEIQVKGPNVFSEYWQRPKETKKSFQQGWFKTGDVAILENGIYKILGRNSVEIIKSGGYKVSALEIEGILQTHRDIKECAVIGIPDAEWGESVAVALVLKTKTVFQWDTFRKWAKSQLAPYKVPVHHIQMKILPRNAMGKVNKAKLANNFQGAVK